MEDDVQPFSNGDYIFYALMENPILVFFFYVWIGGSMIWGLLTGGG